MLILGIVGDPAGRKLIIVNAVIFFVFKTKQEVFFPLFPILSETVFIVMSFPCSQQGLICLSRFRIYLFLEDVVFKFFLLIFSLHDLLE